MIEAFVTFTDGTLVDLAVSEDGVIIVRAGRSLTPAERPEVLRMTFADLVDLNRAAVPLFQAVAPHPKGAA